jgi:threonine/homoserine/homoserine lactone efflux protein
MPLRGFLQAGLTILSILLVLLLAIFRIHETYPRTMEVLSWLIVVVLIYWAYKTEKDVK